MKSKISYLILLIVVSSCNNSTRYDFSKRLEISPKDIYTFTYSDSDTLELDVGFMENYADYQSTAINGLPYYIGLNAEEMSLDFIPLGDKGDLKRTVFVSEGPDGIKGGMDGFFYHNQDSIFVLSIEANTIYLMNEDSRMIDEYSFLGVPLPDGFENYDAYADVGLKNGPFYSPSSQTLQFYTYRWLPSSQDDFNYKAFASYSIKDRKFTSVYGHYPANYVKGANFLLYNDPNLLVVDSISYTMLGASPEIYKYNNLTGELLAVSADHCEYWDKSPEPFMSTVNDFQKELEWLVSEPAFVSLIYNGENDLIFRFLKHRQPVLGSDGLLNDRWFGPWSISIFTRDLARVGHYEIPKNTLLPVSSFFSEGDLWIKNPSSMAEEGESLYHKFKLKKTQNE